MGTLVSCGSARDRWDTAHSGDGGDSLLPLATLRTLSSFLAGDKRGYFRLTINHNRANSAVSRELLVEGRYPEVTNVWLLPHYSGYYCCQAAARQAGGGQCQMLSGHSTNCAAAELGPGLENAAAPCRGWLSLLNWPLGHPAASPAIVAHNAATQPPITRPNHTSAPPLHTSTQ